MNLQNVDIKELKNSYELHQCDWAKRCLDNIEKEMKQLQTKANKYDSLIEKIEEIFKKRRLKILQENKEPEHDIVLNVLQELMKLESEDKQC